MNPTRWLKTAVKGTDDPLAAYRLRAMRMFAIVGAVFLVPFAINNFIQGRSMLGAAVLGITLAFGVDAIAIHRKKKPPIPFALLLLPAVIAIWLTMETLGIIGAFWCYPAVLFFYFVLSARMANVCSLILLVAATLMLYRYTEPAITIRFTVTLTLTILVINSILIIIGDLQQKLVAQAITDPLTGVFNRRHMDTRLGEAIERDRRSSTPASLLLIDIDDFKRFNDQFGHDTGDRILIQVVRLITERSRKLDSLFRIGGEEFLQLLPSTHGVDAVHVAEHLCAAIAELSLLEGMPITVSIGVSELHAGDSKDAWIKRADEALYAAKNAGRNRVVRAHSPHLKRDRVVRGPGVIEFR